MTNAFPADLAAHLAAVVMQGFTWDIYEHRHGVSLRGYYHRLLDICGEDVPHMTIHWPSRDTWADRFADGCDSNTAARKIYRDAANQLNQRVHWKRTPDGHEYWATLYGVLLAAANCRLLGQVGPAKAKPEYRPLRNRFERITDKLKARGYRHLAGGAFSVVYVHDADPDHVIKVNKQADDWPVFVKWGHDAGYAGVFTPVVVSMKVYEDGTYVAKMKRLAKTVRDADYKCGFDTCEAQEFCSDVAEVAKRKEAPENYYELKHMIRNPKTDALVSAGTEYFNSKRAGLGDFLAEFSRKFNKGRYDMHGGNWMLDKEGNVFLTDPLTDEGYLRKDAYANVRIKTNAPVFA